MPIYEIEAPDGRIIEMEGDKPPSEKDIQDAFSMISGPSISDTLIPQAAEATGIEAIQELEQMGTGVFEREKRQALQEKIRETKLEAMKGDNPWISRLFPRGMEAEVDDSDPLRTFGAGVGDTFTGVGRVLAAVLDFKGDTWDEKFENFFDSIGKTEGDDVLSTILRHPATGAAMVLAPRMMPKAGKAAIAQGVGEGAGVALISQLSRVGEGKDVDPIEAGLDIVSGGILPSAGAFGKTMQSGMKNTGEKIMESVIKPVRKLTQRQGSRFDVSNIFKYGLDSKRGLGVMKKNIANRMRQIETEYGSALKDIPKDSKINLQDALNKAKRKLAEEVNSGQHASDYEGIKKGLDYWQNYIDDLGKSEVGVKESLSIRKGVGDMAKYDKMDVKAIKGADKAARYFRSEINNKLDVYPKIRKLDAKRADIIPLQEAVDDAAPRLRKSFIQHLSDNPALMTLMMGGGTGAYLGGAKGGMIGMAPGFGLLGLSRAQKSPGFASALYRGGDALSPMVTITQNPYIQKTIPGLARPFFSGLGGEQ